MTHWKFFKEQDIVDVVAPGYAVKADEVEKARAFLLRWNLVPRIPKDIIKPHFLHAHEDEERFDFLKTALLAKDSKAIWCLRGGYGSNRLLPLLAKLKKPREPKLLIGISDITSLHTFLIQEWGWSTLHGPLLDRLGKNLVSPRHEKELHNILFGAQAEIEFKKLKPLNGAAQKVKTLRSKIVGGNLTVLQSTLGTPWQIRTRGSLLFVEDLGERGYRLDRMFEQFRQAGLFKSCSGLVLGDFIGGEEPATGKNNFKKVFKRWSQDLEIPVFQGLEAGHASVQRPVPLNTPCVLEVKEGRGRLIVKTGGTL